jgi:hypothetical protein
MRFHIGLFVWGGTANLSYDAWIPPNDFRNMFILAAVLYSLTLVLIVIMNRRSLSTIVQLILSPCFMLAWYIVGSDGTTAKSGQILLAG